ncbi:MAG: hypothetical protein JNJ62_05440 [Pseudoxanthomonas mexicana]|uniref:hypothetical protein n=1 Tax=Pseudoxanthomonas mexicana TaxID=128785 RepID=UPI00078298DF|nr:hypothetical protein [Pseudoxanthomonas mexicana]MBL8256024.1 hypothetical protein [Pseudoxanthomonas mexicana]
MSIADAGFSRFGELASTGSFVLIIIGCVLLHVRLRKPASLSLLMALATTAVWDTVGQSMVHDLLMTPTATSLPPGTSGMNAQAAIDALDRAAPAHNALIAGDSILFIWVALSFVLAVASIARPRGETQPDGETSSPDTAFRSHHE